MDSVFLKLIVFTFFGITVIFGIRQFIIYRGRYRDMQSGKISKQEFAQGRYGQTFIRKSIFAMIIFVISMLTLSILYSQISKKDDSSLEMKPHSVQK